jgi:hypothetical protein
MGNGTIFRSSAETLPTSLRAADLARPLERLQHVAQSLAFDHKWKRVVKPIDSTRMKIIGVVSSI